LGELRDQQAENKKGKQVKIDQLTALNNSLKKKVRWLFESPSHRLYTPPIYFLS
jgi:hypothetical protein